MSPSRPSSAVSTRDLAGARPDPAARRGRLAAAAFGLALGGCGGGASPHDGATNDRDARGTTDAAPFDGGALPDGGATPDGGARLDGGATPDGGARLDGAIADGAGPRDAAADGASCAAGQTRCGAACVDTVTSAAHCGRCDNACAAPTGCFASACARPAPMPLARGSAEAVVGLDGRVYVMGGFQYGGQSVSSTNDLQIYDPRTNAWRAGPRMSNIRAEFGSALGRDGSIYACGGSRIAAQVNQVLSDCEAYNPRTNAWRTLLYMPKQRERFAATMGTDGRFYVFGGSDFRGDALTLAHVYDPATNRWAALPPLATARDGGRAVTGADGRIYVFGGYRQLASGSSTPLSTVEVYDPATNRWQTSANLALAVSFDAEVLGNTVYAVENQATTYTLPGLGRPSTVLPGATLDSSATAIAPDGRLFAAGGEQTVDRPVSTALLIYDPSVARWIR